MRIAVTPISCGILELWDLRITHSRTSQIDTAKFLYETECQRQSYLHPFVLFSDNNEDVQHAGETLREALIADGHKVRRSALRMNPNTRRSIRVYIWEPSETYMRSVSRRTGAR